MKTLAIVLALLSFASAAPDEPVVRLITVHDGRSYAIEAALPKLSKGGEGFSLRESWWKGMMKQGEVKVIRHQLYARNDYWFWAGLSDRETKVSIHIYDEDGKLVDAEAWEKGNVAGARVTPKRTGSYLIRIKIEEAAGEVPWAVVYGFR